MVPQVASSICSSKIRWAVAKSHVKQARPTDDEWSNAYFYSVRDTETQFETRPHDHMTSFFNLVIRCSVAWICSELSRPQKYIRSSPNVRLSSFMTTFPPVTGGSHHSIITVITHVNSKAIHSLVWAQWRSTSYSQSLHKLHPLYVFTMCGSCKKKEERKKGVFQKAGSLLVCVNSALLFNDVSRASITVEKNVL